MIVLKILLGLLAVFFVHSIVPTYYNKLFNKRVVKEVDGDKNIMLTFDDGPDRRYIYDIHGNIKTPCFIPTFIPKKILKTQ